MKSKWILALAGLAVIAAGCATTETEVVAEAPAEDGGAIEYLAPQIPRELNSVEFLDDGLVKAVAVQKTTYRRTNANTFEVLCTLKNLTDDPVRVRARTQYFDADRLHQEGPGAWRMIFLPANGIETYKSNSYATSVEYYHVEVDTL